VTAPPAPQRALIIKPSSLGDVITGLPVLRALRRAFPDAHLGWLVNAPLAGILDGEAALDEIIGFDRRRFGRMWRSPRSGGAFAAFCRDLRRRRFDWAVDLQGLFRSGFLARVSGAPVRAGFARAREAAWLFYTHRIETAPAHTVDRNIALARGLGLDARPDDLRLTVTERGRRFAAGILAETPAPPPCLVVAPGTRWLNKLYPRRHWRAVLESLGGTARIVLVGAPDERELCDALAAAARADVVNLAGETDLGELVGVIAAADALLCCDSAAGLIAAAVDTPFVMLTGPTRPERTGPYGRLGRALAADVPCIGCLRRRCRHATCMQLIDPARVADAARGALRRARRAAAEA